MSCFAFHWCLGERRLHRSPGTLRLPTKGTPIVMFRWLHIDRCLAIIFDSTICLQYGNQCRAGQYSAGSYRAGQCSAGQAKEVSLKDAQTSESTRMMLITVINVMVRCTVVYSTTHIFPVCTARKGSQGRNMSASFRSRARLPLHIVITKSYVTSPCER